jgi:hypothetical protein
MHAALTAMAERSTRCSCCVVAHNAEKQTYEHYS